MANGIEDEIASKKWFHQFFVLPGVMTPGVNPVDASSFVDAFEELHNVEGKTILEIGALDGAYTLELEKRGAKVTALDIQDPDRTGFNTTKKLNRLEAEYVRCNVYQIPDSFKERFDIVLYMGVYYHLLNPLYAFKKIWDSLKPSGSLIFEGNILEYSSNIEGRLKGKEQLLRSLTDMPVSYFAVADFADDTSNWFSPTIRCLKDWLQASGFKAIQTRDPHERYSRVAGTAVKVDDFDHFEYWQY